MEPFKSLQPAQDSKPGLIVDHFCGGGGASTGILAALGRAPDIAINHSPDAIAIHSANHPQTLHYCESIWDVNPREATAGRPVDLLWASPSCTHFSRAKGAAPLDRKIRGLPWVTVSWAAATRPRTILVENVEEMLTWGPLTPEGRPDPLRKGETYAQWEKALKDLGYTVGHRVLDAADFGAPTHRRRLFVQAQREGELVWPTPTHGAPVAAGVALDWTHLGEPLEARRRALSPETQSRVLAALAQHGTLAPNGNLAALYTYQFGGQGRSIARPAGAVTAGDRLALVQRSPGGRVFFRSLLVTEVAALMGFPQDYAHHRNRKEALAALGNAVVPQVAEALVRAAGSHLQAYVPAAAVLDWEDVGQSVAGRQRDLSETTRAKISAALSQLGEVSPTGTWAALVQYNGMSLGRPISRPLGALTTVERYGLAQLHPNGDVTYRMLTVPEMLAAQGFPQGYRLPGGKRRAVAMIGNSVSPVVARALVAAAA